MEAVIALWARTWKKHSFLTNIKVVKIPLLIEDNALLIFFAVAASQRPFLMHGLQ